MRLTASGDLVIRRLEIEGGGQRRRGARCGPGRVESREHNIGKKKQAVACGAGARRCPAVEDVLTELASAPLSAFTQARDALVARLTKLGQAQAAARVKAVRRPTVPLWAVNRLAREERESVERLIAAADQMRAAQLGRGASAADFARASTEQRAALAHLTERAGERLRKAGFGATHQVLMRVETTLAGAAAQLRPALRQGRLEHELAARGFDVFAGEELPPRRRAATPVGSYGAFPGRGRTVRCVSSPEARMGSQGGPSGRSA